MTLFHTMHYFNVEPCISSGSSVKQPSGRKILTSGLGGLSVCVLVFHQVWWANLRHNHISRFVVSCHKSLSFSLHYFKLVAVLICVGVRYYCSIRHYWNDQWIMRFSCILVVNFSNSLSGSYCCLPSRLHWKYV